MIMRQFQQLPTDKKISPQELKTEEEVKINTENPRRGMGGQHWRTLKRIPFG